ncbi:MAG: CARDB domain-containing protein, partial [bacterium]
FLLGAGGTGPLTLTASEVAGSTRLVWSGTGLNMTPGTSYIFTITATAGRVCATEFISNTAFAVASEGCGSVGAASIPVMFKRAGSVLQISVAKGFIGSPVANGTLYFTITVTNTSPTETVNNLVVSDPLPAAVTFAGGDVNSTYTTGTRTVSWTSPGALAPLTSIVFSVTVTNACGAIGSATISNTAWATATYACGTAQASGATSYSLPTFANLDRVVSTASTVRVGQTLTVTYTVSNSGNLAMSAVTPALGIVSGAGSVSLTAGPGAAVALAAGLTKTFTWTFAASAPGTVVFSVSAIGTTCAGSVTTTGGVTARVQGLAALTVAAASDVTKVKEGEVITVTVTVKNTGDGAASGVVPTLTLSDATLADVTTAPAVPGDALAAGGTKTWVWKLTAKKAGALTVTAAATGVNVEDGAASAPGVALPLALGEQRPDVGRGDAGQAQQARCFVEREQFHGGVRMSGWEVIGSAQAG